ncbi:PIN domain-containing protein [Turneriella parva]|uniref:PilT protein domain-containing protein n=1 Tax=Turneriella parva (strain ATCC BAA-1111 / DSM 21527 / NCTC 11395 / H) TaxID=869212 RepID=I4B3Y6_TURPD|nr:PIN domain-containing protein [Turneriella parva]AFM11993.1 PilT protein domain-containing protein [Turneriella parva DSM 21527]
MNDRLRDIVNAEVFIDTNILFYGVNIANAEKYAQAGALLELLWQKASLPSISTQVLQEFYVTLIRNKVKIDEAQKIVKDYYVWNVVPTDTKIIDEAFQIQKRYVLSFWDSLVLASAQQSHCAYVLTEDLNHGQKYGKTTVINPFHSGYGA